MQTDTETPTEKPRTTAKTVLTTNDLTLREIERLRRSDASLNIYYGSHLISRVIHSRPQDSWTYIEYGPFSYPSSDITINAIDIQHTGLDDRSVIDALSFYFSHGSQVTVTGDTGQPYRGRHVAMRSRKKVMAGLFELGMSRKRRAVLRAAKKKIAASDKVYSAR